MALTAERRRQLAAMDIPSEDEVRTRVIEFEQRSGLTRLEFSQALGYSAGMLGLFLGGHYNVGLSKDHDQAHNTLNIRARAVEFMERWDSIQVLLPRQSMHRTSDVRRVMDACCKALSQASAYVIDGPPGTQKTFSLRAFEREMKQAPGRGRALYIYARANHSPLSFLREICNSAGVPSKGDIDKLIRKLRFFLSQERMLLMVDEAQHLPPITLEILRQLLDLPPFFGVIAAGSHEVSQKLDTLKMAQWHDRVHDTLELNGPAEQECRDIIRTELQPLFPEVLTDANCDSLIGNCWVTAARVDCTGRKPVPRSFKYISARLLFLAIAEIQQTSNRQPIDGSQKATA